MAEGIRLDLSLVDRFTGAMKEPHAALVRLQKTTAETKFKFQYAWASMEDAVRRFSVSGPAEKVKQLAAAMHSAIEKMKAGWSQLQLGVARAGGGIANVVTKIRQSLTSLPAMIASSAIALGFAAAIKSGLQFNATLETLQIQFKVMTGDAQRAKNIMGELVKFAAKTPFELAEVATAARVMMAFGIQGTEMLRRVGDAAAAAQRPMEEVAMTFGRIKSGAFGEAFQRLAEMGLATRSMLEAEGLKFDKSGSYTGSVNQAMDAISRIVDTRFKGMMEQMSQTFSGKISTIKDSFSILLGVATGRTFDMLKGKLDRLDSGLQRLVSNGTAGAIGEAMAKPIGWVVEKLLWMLDNLPKVLGWFAKIGQTISLVWDTMKAGAAWVYNAFSAIVTLITEKLGAVGKAAAKAMAQTGGVSAANPGSTLAFGANLMANLFNQKDGGAGAKAAEKNIRQTLADALAAPGITQTWRDGWAKIQGSTFTMPRRGGLTFLEEMLRGSGGGPGLDASPEPRGLDWRAQLGVGGANRRQIGPVSPFAGASTAAVVGGGGIDRSADLSRNMEFDAANARFEALVTVQGKMAAIDAEYRKNSQDMWREYYTSLGGMAQDLFVDSMTTLILEKSENLKQALNGIWQSMKASFVRMTIDMATSWAVMQVKKMVAERAAQAGATAGQVAASVPKIAALTAETAAYAAAGTAGYYSSMSWAGPFGIPVATAMTASMNAAIIASRAINMIGAFRTGGLVPGGGSGNADDKYAKVSGGEFMQPQAAVNHYGKDFMEDVRTMRFTPAGGTTLNLSFPISGGAGNAADLRRDIEREVVPILESLVKQRRLKVA